MNFYENFLRLCNSVGKSPSGVALEIGISKPTVNRWKNGSTPTDATMRRVADYFGVSIADLKETLSLEDVLYMTAKNAGKEKAVSLLTKEKPADQKVDGLRGTGYDLLTPENKGMIDSLIAKLLESQSGE